MATQLLLGLSILVGLHEWGHMIAAKSFGMRVEKYSIGFPPKIWSKKIGETEYSIGMIPLGGFVKIAGMVDESLSSRLLSKAFRPYEFRAKPAWQRLIVMLGGIIVNVISGVIIFISLAYVNGDSYLPKEELNKHGIVADDLGKQLGFKTGDKVLDINGRDYERFSDIISAEILLGSGNFFTVARNNEKIIIEMPDDFFGELSANKGLVILPRHRFSVGSVAKNSNAEKSGLMADDKIISINGRPVTYFDEFRAILNELKGQKIEATILRSQQQIVLEMEVDNDGILGFTANNDLNYIKRRYGFPEAVKIGTSHAFSIVWLNIKGFNKIFSGDVNLRKALMGPVGIMKQFGGTWHWRRFWNLVGFLSMVLAFMNLLPIPALDGGYVIFLAWEIVSGRKPSNKFMEGAVKFGMVILIALLAFVIINDIIQF